MRKIFSLAALMILLAATLAQAEDTSDLARLQGAWVAERVEADGKPVAAMVGRHATIVGDKFTSGSGATESVSSLVLRPNAKPKEMDSTNEKGETTIAIYMIAGDTLQICAALPIQGAKRPGDFTTHEADGRMLFLYKLAK